MYFVPEIVEAFADDFRCYVAAQRSLAAGCMVCFSDLQIAVLDDYLFSPTYLRPFNFAHAIIPLAFVYRLEPAAVIPRCLR